MHALGDLQGGGQWLGEDGHVIRHIIRHHMQVSERQGQVIGKGPIVVEDAQHPAALAMAAVPAAARRALATGDIDLAYDAPAFPGSIVGTLLDYTAKLVTQNSLEALIAAHQFEIYHSFDNVDRENGIWRYLSQTKAIGREKAREGLLKYEKDDREPFPDVYRLFAGDISADELLKKIKDSKLSDQQRQQRLFYAELYVGLNEFVEGRLESAEQHLGLAAKNEWGSKAGGGPGYMWHVARVHHDLLVDELAKAKKNQGTSLQRP